MAYTFPVPETPFNLAAYTVGNVTRVTERGGDSYTGRVTDRALGKPGGTMLVTVEKIDAETD
jgi:hypothetical protein